MATEGGTTSKQEEFDKWLDHYGLIRYKDALIKEGLDELGTARGLEEEDVVELAKDAKLVKLHIKILKKAVSEAKNGQYPPKPDLASEEKKDDDGFGDIRANRSHLKGMVEIERGDPDKNDGKITKTVIFIGQTGAGKTTLINSMCNYLSCVAYHEPFRYEIIVESKDDSIAKDQTKSQTREITMYHVRDLPAIDRFALNIVDTPGFGDTEGPEQDMKIRGKFKEFFKKIDTIDGIYFVVKASDTRLGATQKYIFNMVLDLFGEDVKDNIFILFTFSDGAVPPALKAVQTLDAFKEKVNYFTINNSGFGLPTGKEAATHEIYFKLGIEQFKSIFDYLTAPEFKAVSINNSLQTLSERDNITNWLYKISQSIKFAMDEQDRANELVEKLKANRTKMDANEDYEIETWETEIVEVPTKNYTTFCPNCTSTCHENCGIPDDKKKLGCWAINSATGLCNICKDKCPWHVHRNMPYVIDRVQVKKMKTNKELFKQYNLAHNEAANCETLCNKMLEQIQQRQDYIRATIVKMRKSVNRLKEIALNKKVLTDKQYFDKLIMQEKEDRKGNWARRVEQLIKMRDENELLKEMVQGDENQFIKKNKLNQVDDIKKVVAVASPSQNKRAKKEKGKKGLKVNLGFVNIDIQW